MLGSSKGVPVAMTALYLFIGDKTYLCREEGT
jgi:hypothetical protein